MRFELCTPALNEGIETNKYVSNEKFDTKMFSLATITNKFLWSNTVHYDKTTGNLTVTFKKSKANREPLSKLISLELTPPWFPMVP